MGTSKFIRRYGLFIALLAFASSLVFLQATGVYSVTDAAVFPGPAPDLADSVDRCSAYPSVSSVRAAPSELGRSEYAALTSDGSRFVSFNGEVYLCAD